MQTVWIFNGAGAKFPAAAFSERANAEQWIRQHDLNGIPTAYPLDTGIFDWAVSTGHFTPKRDDQRSAEFIQQFSSASQAHYHYKHGNAEA